MEAKSREGRLPRRSEVEYKSQSRKPQSKFAATPPNGIKKKPNYGLQRDYDVLAKQKKVSNILSDLKLRSKLESILQDQIEGKKQPKIVSSPQDEQTEQPPTSSRGQPPLVHSHGARHMPAAVAAPHILVPIDDLDRSEYSSAEALARCKLASAYRLADLLGWCRFSHSIITAVYPDSSGTFFIVADNKLCYEVAASSLVHVDKFGQVIDKGGSPGVQVSEPGAWFHSVMYRSRPDVGCIFHLQSTETMAVSAMACGLLPLSSHAISVGKSVYCEASWFDQAANEGELAAILGESQVVVLRGCGILALGRDVEDAFRTAHTVVRACQVQVATLSAGLQSAMKDISELWWDCNGGRGSRMEFEALMRMLDRMGMKTGYQYDSDDKRLRDLRGRDQREETQVSNIKSNKEVDKPTELRNESSTTPHQPLGESLCADTLGNIMDTAQRVAKSTGEALEEITASSRNQHLDLSNQVNLTAKRVAQSTKEALERTMIQGTESQSSNWSNQLTATAHRVAQSTGEEREKAEFAAQDYDRSRNDSLGRIQETARRVAKSTEEALEQASGVRHVESPSMLKETELVAQRVARSTGHARQSLEGREERTPTYSHIEIPSGKRNIYSHGEYSSFTPFGPTTLSGFNDTSGQAHAIEFQRKLPPLHSTPLQAKAIVKDKVSSPLHNRYLSHRTTPRTPAHKNEVRKTHRRKKVADSLSSSSEYSTTESSELPPGYRSKSLMVHRQSVINDPDLYESPLQKMAHTAELVAASTGQAVAKLTSSLLS